MGLELVDRRQHTNMSWNGLSLDTRSEEKYAWGTNTTYDTKESGLTLSFQRGNGSGFEDQLFGSSSFSFSAFQTSGAGKSNFQLPGQGVGQHNSDGGLYESQDFHRAHSLLSTSSDSRGTKNNNPLAESQPIFAEAKDKTEASKEAGHESNEEEEVSPAVEEP